MTDRPIKHLNQVELSRRWSVSPRTVERWRWLGQGPCFLKIGGRVLYRLDDIEAFEAQHLRSTNERARMRQTAPGGERSAPPAGHAARARMAIQPIASTRSTEARNGATHHHR